jgi:hypothetical protein
MAVKTICIHPLVYEKLCRAQVYSHSDQEMRETVTHLEAKLHLSYFTFGIDGVVMILTIWDFEHR